MSEKYKVRNPDSLYFITITVVDWIDLFTRPEYKHILIDSLNYCIQNKGLILHAYVIMTSHLHLIVSTKCSYNLPEIVRDFKKHTSKELIKCIKESPESRKEWILEKFSGAAERIKRGVNYKIWQDGFHPVELDSVKIIEQRLNYIHNNPVEEEIVENPEDYIYSSAKNYCGLTNVLEIAIIN